VELVVEVDDKRWQDLLILLSETDALLLTANWMYTVSNRHTHIKMI